MAQALRTLETDSPPGTEGLGELLSEITEIFCHLLGLDSATVDEDMSFVELGAESLLLLQFSQALQKRLGVKIHFRALIEHYVTLGELTGYLGTLLPAVPEASAVPAALPAVAVSAPRPVPPPAPVPVSPQPVLWREAVPANVVNVYPTGNGDGPGAVEGGAWTSILGRQLQLMDQQLRVTAQQLQLLSRAEVGWGPAAGVRPEPVAAPASPPSAVSPAASPPPRPLPAASASRKEQGRLRPAPWVAHVPAETRRSRMSEQQERHLDALAERLERKAQGSKRLTQEYRRDLADNRTAVAFRLAMKELLYPIFVEQAQGARVWDVDGNEYVDVTMGFGTLLLGHSPPFVVEALKRQSERGLGIGLEPPLSGPAARLLCELTGNERAAFVNDGTEAVKSAVRLARTRTGRMKIAMFQGGYHGWFDDVMAIARRDPDGRTVTVPMAPGVSPQIADNVLVLEYCTPEAIETLAGCAHELAAVVVDPQQTRRPGAFDTRDFLHDIRRVTAASGAAMILDEVVTGFRIHPGGAQAHYGLRADLVAYGKAVGAGLPIGVVSGKAEYLDGIDGGHWSYGDGSYPQADQTFIQGSYFKHPLVMPAIWAVLKHLKDSGPRLQEELTAKMTHMAGRLRRHFEREGLPIELFHWGSIGNFIFGPEVKYPSLFFYHLLDRGLYVRDARPWFLSTAHTERDIDDIVAAVEATTAAMQEGGFLPRAAAKPDGAKPRDPRVEAAV